jgi:hypothetical protein
MRESAIVHTDKNGEALVAFGSLIFFECKASLLYFKFTTLRMDFYFSLTFQPTYAGVIRRDALLALGNIWTRITSRPGT